MKGSIEIWILFMIHSFRVVCPFSYENVNHLNFEDIFGQSKCIEEPSDNFFMEYLTQSQEGATPVSTNDVNIKNYRSEINRLVLYYNIDHSYNIENEEGLSHKKLFNISLKLGDEIYYGAGKSKKEAKEMAAKKAIENTNYKKPPEKLKNENSDIHAPPTVRLNNLGAKHGYKIDYYIIDPMVSNRIINLNAVKEKSLFTNASFWKEVAHLDQPPKGPFHIEVDVDGRSFYGKAHTIQAAKHDAALKAIETLQKLEMDKNSHCTMIGHEMDCRAAKDKLKSPISLVYEYAQLKRLNVEFNELRKLPPDHKPTFEFECVLGPLSKVATGKSKNEAKKHAAEEMLKEIPHMEFIENYTNDEVSTKSSKKKKKIRNKIKNTKSSFDIAKDTLNNFVSFFSSNDDQKDEQHSEEVNGHSKKSQKKLEKKNNQWSPKEKLLEVGKALNLNIQFSTQTRKNGGYHSLVNLDLNPKYICLGNGNNEQISQEHSSLNALKFLHKLDILEDIEQEDLDIERFSFDNFIWLAKEDS
ncbi:hypothetical protein HHI36_022233 [Cryptolaemus montrouzieri]|uniref:DRBM domain-containing protein n=1 Tax=Cryptolaemus montrouzieri TaxID=559131 RepID=A0ABD2MZA0_9CUCU